MENGLNYLSRFPENMQVGHFFNESSNPELDYKVKKVTEKFSDSLHIIANEPSLAFFRIQEHVRRSLPALVEKRHEVQEVQQQVQGACFDTEYAINAVKGMRRSCVHFQNIQDLLKNAMFMKQQIEYEHLRKEQERLRPSMYRTMMRTNTIDIPASMQSTSISTADMVGNATTQDGSPRLRSSSMSAHERARKTASCGILRAPLTELEAAKDKPEPEPVPTAPPTTPAATADNEAPSGRV